MNDEAGHLVCIAVDAAFRMDERVGSPYHVDQRPQPRWAILIVSMKSVDDRPALDVHRIDRDFIGLFSHRSNPRNAMVKRIGFAHERRLEHQVGLDAKIEFFQVFNGPIPRFGGEPFVDMEPQDFVVVSLESKSPR